MGAIIRAVSRHGIVIIIRDTACISESEHEKQEPTSDGRRVNLG